MAGETSEETTARPSEAEILLRQIEDFCRETKMAQTTFGRLAVNDGKLISRLQQGGRITLQTAEKIHSFIEQEGGPRAEKLRSAFRGPSIASPPADFRFYSNRQKYLLFVNTTSEKAMIADRALREIAGTQPRPPAIRMLDSGAGDGTVLSKILRGLHRKHPSAPFYVVAKEISVENTRLLLEKMPDRLQEHPSTVLVLTNLKSMETLHLHPDSPADASRMIWRDFPLDGNCAGDFEEQIASLDSFLHQHWQTQISSSSGNPLYRTPVVLVLYRHDQRFALDPIRPRRGLAGADFDFVLMSQPYRARASLEFKVEKLVAPLVRGLRANGKLMGVQSFGHDPGMEIIQEVWPEDRPFVHGRNAILARTREALGAAARHYDFRELPHAQAVFRYDLRTLPGEIDADHPMGMSTILAAWNAATYAAQVEDERLAGPMRDRYSQVTRDTLLRHGGLWFNDEVFVITRRPDD